MAGDNSLGLHSHRAEPMVSDLDLLELLDRVSLSGELSWMHCGSARLHRGQSLLLCHCHESPASSALSAGLADRVGGFDAEAEWSHILRCCSCCEAS